MSFCGKSALVVMMVLCGVCSYGKFAPAIGKGKDSVR